MKRIELLGTGADVMPLLWAIHAHPELWDQNRERTCYPESPHYGLHDIWCRYAPRETAMNDVPQEAVWYPAADVLPVKDMAMRLMHQVGGKKLGGVLITRIPPGGICRPHADVGWHASHHEKFGVQVQSSPGQRFHFEGESLETRPGDVFWFDNSHTHWVTNPTPHDRITMIVCIRRQED